MNGQHDAVAVDDGNCISGYLNSSGQNKHYLAVLYTYSAQ